MKAILTSIAAALLLVAASLPPAMAHDDEHFSAGEPGNPKKPARVIQVTTREADGKMLFIPDRVDVRKGEQIRFIIRNNGALDHEFTLGSVEDHNTHAELMKNYSGMAHDDPNAKTIAPGKTAEIIWRFTKAGTFEFACLIPGHREAGMHGMVTVK